MGTTHRVGGRPNRNPSGETAIHYIPNEGFGSITRRKLIPPAEGVHVSGQPGVHDSGAATAGEFTLTRGLQQSQLLSLRGERYLFLRMNWLRYRAERVRSSLESRQPSERKRALLQSLLADADAMRAIIAGANLRLVASIAGRLSSTADEFDEFVAEGNAILLHAIDRFDFARGFRFSTYATHAIQRRLFRLIKRRSRRAHRENSSPGCDLAEIIEADEMPDRLEAEEQQQVTARLLASIEGDLDEREQLIVRARFGLDGTGEGKTLRLLAEQLGLSKERIRQLLQRALGKLTASAGPAACDLAV